MNEVVPRAVQDCRDLLRWLIPHLDKFPRARRFTLGERLETALLDVLAELTDAAYRVWPHRRRLRHDNGHRFARRLRGYAAAYARGDMDWSDVHPRVRSWVGHALQADTAGLRRRILSGTVFVRGAGRQTAAG